MVHQVPEASFGQKPNAVTSSLTTYHEFDVSAENIMFENGGSFRVSLEMTHTGFPNVAIDQDGTIDVTRNWYKTAGGVWNSSGNVGLTGDFIIRATILK